MDFQQQNRVPIGQLSPSVDTANKSIRGIVSLIWPYSSSKKSTSILLVEPDYRLRTNNGQVKVTFLGSSAREVARSHLTPGDEVILYLVGATWLEANDTAWTPGRTIAWELRYTKRVVLEILRAADSPILLDVNSSSRSPDSISAESPSLETLLDLEIPLGQERERGPENITNTWASPAFLKKTNREAMSVLSSYFFTQDDASFSDTRGSKRIRFGRSSDQWRFADRTPSPVKKRYSEQTLELERTNNVDEDSPTFLTDRVRSTRSDRKGHNVQPLLENNHPSQGHAVDVTLAQISAELSNDEQVVLGSPVLEVSRDKESRLMVHLEGDKLGNIQQVPRSPQAYTEILQTLDSPTLSAIGELGPAVPRDIVSMVDNLNPVQGEISGDFYLIEAGLPVMSDEWKNNEDRVDSAGKREPWLLVEDSGDIAKAVPHVRLGDRKIGFQARPEPETWPTSVIQTAPLDFESDFPEDNKIIDSIDNSRGEGPLGVAVDRKYEDRNAQSLAQEIRLWRPREKIAQLSYQVDLNENNGPNEKAESLIAPSHVHLRSQHSAFRLPEERSGIDHDHSGFEYGETTLINFKREVESSKDSIAHFGEQPIEVIEIGSGTEESEVESLEGKNYAHGNEAIHDFEREDIENDPPHAEEYEDETVLAEANHSRVSSRDTSELSRLRSPDNYELGGLEICGRHSGVQSNSEKSPQRYESATPDQGKTAELMEDFMASRNLTKTIMDEPGVRDLEDYHEDINEQKYSKPTNKGDREGREDTRGEDDEEGTEVEIEAKMAEEAEENARAFGFEAGREGMNFLEIKEENIADTMKAERDRKDQEDHDGNLENIESETLLTISQDHQPRGTRLQESAAQIQKDKSEGDLAETDWNFSAIEQTLKQAHVIMMAPCKKRSEVVLEEDIISRNEDCNRQHLFSPEPPGQQASSPGSSNSIQSGRSSVLVEGVSEHLDKGFEILTPILTQYNTGLPLLKPSQVVSEHLENGVEIMTPVATQDNVGLPLLKPSQVISGHLEKGVEMLTPVPTQDNIGLPLFEPSEVVSYACSAFETSSLISPGATDFDLAHEQTVQDELGDPMQNLATSLPEVTASLGATRRRSSQPFNLSPTESKNFNHVVTTDTVKHAAANDERRVINTRSRGLDGASESGKQSSPIISNKPPEWALKGIRTQLSYFTTLASSSEHFNSAIDLFAIVVYATVPARAKSGPRHMIQTLYLVDPSLESKSPLPIAKVVRPFRSALPSVCSGDVILLRNFKVQIKKNRIELASLDDSAWVVFRKGEEAQVAGPPVEFAEEEKSMSITLHEWWANVGPRRWVELEATVSAERPLEELATTKPRRNSRKSIGQDNTSKPEAISTTHELRNGRTYTDTPKTVKHDLRDRKVYTDE